MNFNILSAKKAAQYFPDELDKEILIRIRSSNSQFPALSYKSCFKGILELEFDDISYEKLNKNSKKNACIFTVEKAKRIVQFVQSYQDGISCINIHCDAGVSRSSAVALALAEFMFKDESFSQYIKASNHYSPNTLILDRMREAVLSMDKKL